MEPSMASSDRGITPETTADITLVPGDLYLIGGGEMAADEIDEVERDWRRERPDLDVTSIGIVTRIERVSHHLGAKRKRLLAELATDRGAMDVLAMLRRAGRPYRQNAGQLTKSALITSGGVSQRLEKLERAGLITRHIGTADRRRVDVQLTPAGLELVDAVLADLITHDQSLLDAVMEPHEQAQLRSLLRKLLTSLEPDEAS
jgi:DNA-binding MarR family transcriptional regulator